MKLTFRLLTFALASAGMLAASVNAASVSHVVHVSLDGLGGKYLEFYITNAPAQFPNFVRLTTDGAFTMNARCDYDFSETVPNHATMFTGRPVFQPAGAPDTTHHGYENNFPVATDTLHNAGNLNVPYKSSFFDVAHDHGLPTALYTGKTRLAICERSYDALNGAFDLFGEDNGRDKIDFASIADVSGANISNEVNLLIADLTSTAPKRYSFIHIAEPDLTGHASGWGSANWSNAVRLVDTQLGRILDVLTTNPVLAGQSALIIAADHGGGGVVRNGHTEAYHITNYTIPFFLWGPAVPGGANIYSLMNNRGDPGTNRAEYTVSPQPMRAGDGANLALSLLGLPPIPGSYFHPELRALQPPVAIARAGNLVTLTWPANSPGFFMEFAEDFNEADWRRISSGIVDQGETRSFTFDLQTAPDAGFFRLRTSGLKITSQPSAQTVFAGNPAAFQVQARGTGRLRHQWYRDGRRVNGATNAALNLPVTASAHAGEYTVVVADDRDNATTVPAALTVLTTPIITRQPVDILVASNGVAAFSVEGAGGGVLRYQWLKDGSPLADQTNVTLTFTTTGLGSEGLYSAIVTDANGSIESRGAGLSIAIQPVFIVQPLSQTVAAGSDVTFTVTVSGNPLPFGFEWRKGAVFYRTNAVNSYTTTMTITNVSAADASTYRVVVRNAALPNGRISTGATLTVLTNAP